MRQKRQDRNLLKQVASVLAGSAFLFLSSFQIGIAAETPEIKADAALLADFETGQILLAQNIDEKLGIASMTKMITEYIVLDEIASGHLSWDDQVAISDYAYTISQDFTLSNVYLTQEKTYSVRDLFEAMAIYSANGATIALAEHIAGSEEDFVQHMHELVESFGIEGAEIYNSTGLNNSSLYGYHVPGTPADGENCLSARDMAMIAFHLLNDHPEILEISSVPQKYFGQGTPDELLMINWNWMLEGLSFERSGVDGLKTGTTDIAGPTFTATAVEDGQRLVSVLLNAEAGNLDNLAPRFIETNRMLDFGFNEFKAQTVIEKGQVFENYERVPVDDGKEETVAVQAGDNLDFLMHVDDSRDQVVYEVTLNKELLGDQGGLQAPIAKGQEIGRVVARYGDDGTGFVDLQTAQNSVPLVASEDIKSANIFQRLGDQISELWRYFISRF